MSYLPCHRLLFSSGGLLGYYQALWMLSNCGMRMSSSVAPEFRSFWIPVIVKLGLCFAQSFGFAVKLSNLLSSWIGCQDGLIVKVRAFCYHGIAKMGLCCQILL
ncbi:hypothetical protein U1Q18_039827 [Sarracenia purpurea var. burkii]